MNHSVAGVGVKNPFATWRSGSDACPVAAPRSPSDPDLCLGDTAWVFSFIIACLSPQPTPYFLKGAFCLKAGAAVSCVINYFAPGSMRAFPT